MLLYLSCALFLLGIQSGEASEECPPVTSLVCTSDVSSCNGNNVKQAFIQLENGDMCPSCEVCVRNRGNHGNSLHEACPTLPCYAMRIPDDCEPEYYTQYVLVGLRMCQVCGTYRCRNM